MAKAPPADPGQICPFHRTDVSKVCHKCPMYVQLRGKNPTTGADVDNWGCSFAWMPALMVEAAQAARSGAAATESFRNEMVTAQQRPIRLQMPRYPQGPDGPGIPSE